MIETRTTCLSVTRHRDRDNWECTRETAPGKRLCERCTNDIYTALQDLAKAWPRIIRTQYERPHATGEKVTRSRDAALPVNADAIEYVQETTLELFFWVRLILDTDTRLDGPKDRDGNKSVEVPVMARYIATHVDRLIGAEPGDDGDTLAAGLKDDVRGLLSKARLLLDPSIMVRYIPLGVTCLEDGCHAQLHARIRDDELLPAVCDRDWYDPDGTVHRNRIAHAVEPHRFRLIARRGAPADVLRAVGA